MKLFISYSRDDSAWVYELWRNLRDDTAHHVWIDQRIVPASDWWHSILENIEQSDCCVFVMTPKSVESIYCMAELNYALALNKPVLPLMLKTCTSPDILLLNRVQHQDISGNFPIARVLLKIEQGLNFVQLGLAQGNFPPKNTSRPVQPTPILDSIETMGYAEDAVSKGNYSLAEKLFTQVIESDLGVLGSAAKERLSEVQLEREYVLEYRKVQTLAENSATLKVAQKAWQAFIQKYGMKYDPQNLATRFGVVPIVEAQSSNLEIPISTGNAALSSPIALQELSSSSSSSADQQNYKMERFTKRARLVISLSQEEAELLKHNYIGTEHLLLGLVREEGGIAGKVLRDMDLSYDVLAGIVKQLTANNSRNFPQGLELSPNFKRVLELSVDDARVLKHHYIGTEHLLLGLVRNSNGLAVQVLKRLKVNPIEIRQKVKLVLDEAANTPKT